MRQRPQPPDSPPLPPATLAHGRIIAIRTVDASAHRLVETMPCPACEAAIALDDQHLRVVYADASGVARSQRVVRLHDPDCLAAWATAARGGKGA